MIASMRAIALVALILLVSSGHCLCADLSSMEARVCTNNCSHCAFIAYSWLNSTLPDPSELVAPGCAGHGRSREGLRAQH